MPSARVLAVLAAALLAAALLSGCAKKRVAGPPPGRTVEPSAEKPAPRGTYRPYTIAGRTYYPLPEADGFSQEGVASWYGRDFHGRKTANGETYDMYAMTAAHKILPMNTRIRVVNLENGKSAVFRVNDRGPFVGDRVVDLSYQGALSLGFAEKGIARVRLTALDAGPAASRTVKAALEQGEFYVQLGSFTVKDNAYRLLDRLKAQGYTGSRLRKARVRGKLFWRVQAGVFHGLAAAEKRAAAFAREYPSSFILAD